jgi:hypothetical protein
METNEIASQNQFKFGLYISNDDSDVKNFTPIVEKLFDADCYNHATRFSVNIFDYLVPFRHSLIKVLSSKSLGINFVDFEYNHLELYKNNIYDLKDFKSKLDKTKPNHFKFGLYITSKENGKFKSIVERIFSDTYIKEDDNGYKKTIESFKYNPESRFSLELMNCINDIIQTIKDEIKKSDMELMEEDKIVCDKFGISLKEIRLLTKEERKEKIREAIKTMNV